MVLLRSSRCLLNPIILRSAKPGPVFPQKQNLAIVTRVIGAIRPTHPFERGLRDCNRIDTEKR